MPTGELLQKRSTAVKRFCSPESLWALKPVGDKTRSEREDIESSIVVALQRDFSMNYREARQTLFNSDVFLQLSRLESKLHGLPWQEIYEMLKQEPDALQ